MESKKIPIETYFSKLRQYINKWCFEDDDIKLVECEDANELINKLEEELRLYKKALDIAVSKKKKCKGTCDGWFEKRFRDCESCKRKHILELAKEELENGK